MEELYKQLYLKYAPNLSEDELNGKVSYAMTLDRDQFIDSFYNKYTGGNPTQQQSQYISTMADPNEGSGFDVTAKELGTSIGIGKRTFLDKNITAGAEQIVGGFKNIRDQIQATQKDGFQLEDLKFWNWEELSTEQQVANMKEQQDKGVNLGFGRLKSSKMIQDEINLMSATQSQYDNSIFEDLKSGKIGQGMERLLLGGLQSWPSYLAMAHPGALAVLGGLHATGKFNDEFTKNPEEQTSLLLLNAAGTGLIEFGGDYLARRAILSPQVRALAGGNTNQAALDAVKEMGLGVGGRIAKAMGVEGLTEMSQAVAVDFWDSLDKIYGTNIRIGLNNDEEANKLLSGDKKKWHQIFDEGLIGSFMGGNIRVATEGIGGFDNTVQEKRAEILLRTNEDKQYIKDKFNSIQVLQKEIEDTKDPKIIEELQLKMSDLTQEIQNKQSQSSKVVRQMKGQELYDYATNVDTIRSVDEILNKDNVGVETRKIQEAKKQQALEDNAVIYKDHVHRSLNKNLDTSKAYADAAGINQVVIEDVEEYQKAYEKTSYGKTQKRSGVVDDIRNSDGFFDNNNTWYINKTQALKTEAVSVGSHELLHGVMKSSINDANGNMSKEGEALVRSFVETLTPTQRRYVERKINAGYKFNQDGTEKDFKEYGEEYLNAFSDGILKKEIKYDEGILTKIGNLFEGKFLKSGINKNFKDGVDVYDFMKTYNRRISTGKIDTDIVEMLRGKSQAARVVFSKTGGDILSIMDTAANTSKFESKQDFQNNFPPDLASVFTGPLLDGLIMDGIKKMKDPATGAMMIWGLSESEFKEEIKSKLAVKTWRQYDPTKNPSVFGWMTQKRKQGTFMMSIMDNTKNELLKVLEKSYMARLDATREGKDGSVLESQISDTSMNPEEAMIAKQEYREQIKNEDNVRKILGIKKGGSLYNSIISSNESALSGIVDVDNMVSSLAPQFVNNLTDKVVTLMGKGKKYISINENGELVGGFLNDYGQVLIGKIPLKTLVQMERLIPENERVFSRVVKRNMSPKEIRAHEKKYGNSEGLQYESETQGPTLYERVKLTKEGLVKFFNPPSVNPKTGKRSNNKGERKRILAEKAAVELGFDGTFEVIEAEQSKRKSAQLEANKKLLQLEKAKLQKQIERQPGVKLSVTAGTHQLQFNELYDLINKDINPFGIFNQSFTKVKTTIKSKYGSWHQPTVNKIIDALFQETKGGELSIQEGTPEYLGISVIGYLKRKGVTGKDFENQHEQIYIDFINKFNIKGIEVLHDKATNEKNGEKFEHPDLRLAIKGKTYNIELKGSIFDSQGAGISFGWPGSQNAKIEGKNSWANEDANIKRLLDEGEAFRLEYENFIDNNINDYVPGYDWRKNNKVPKDLYEAWKARRNTVSAEIKNADASFYRLLYRRKIYKDNSVDFIEFSGSGLYSLKNRGAKIGGKLVPKFEGKVNYLLTLNGNSAGIENGVQMVNTGFRLRSHIKSLNKKSKVSLLNKADVANIVETSMDYKPALDNNNKLSFTASKTLEESIRKLRYMDKALQMTRRKDAPVKGLSIIDFDDTLAITNSQIYVMTKEQMAERDVLIEHDRFRFGPYYQAEFAKMAKDWMKITPAEFAERSEELEAQGYTFDFIEFNKVIDGKPGPFLEKARKLKEKFGTSDIFVLTARPQASAPAIQKFLKEMDINIPLQNIKGLEDGRPEAKADFIVMKAAQGYNDFLFADDVIKNVEAVQTALDILDVKGKVYQARPKMSLSGAFNEILQDTKGFDENETVSQASARVQGAVNNKWEFYLPPSAEDFVGLMYYFTGKGAEGEAQMKFLRKFLVDPFARAYRMLNHAKQAIATDFKALKEKHAPVWDMTKKDSGYKNFSYGEAVRVYLWNKAGHDIPGMNDTDVIELIKIVQKYDDLIDFAEDLELITRQESYPAPEGYWTGGSITGDLYRVTEKVNRKQYLQEWIQNKNEIFSSDNMNKIEALYGRDYREALEDMLYRMETGTNRKYGQNRQVNQWLDWVNNSVGAIMFFNIRSAMLQTISFANFINWTDNNPLKMAERFADQPQFWKDFSMIFNSDTLKQRRRGLQQDVNAAEMSNAVAKGEGSVNAAISYLLKIGFTPTQMADSFAISFGGASMYRNRYNTYINKGFTEKQAHDTAMNDFFEASEKAQQSARPDMVSQQQAGPLGRIILAFQNTPMQYMRLTKKAILDLKNGRGDVKTNISKIVYYTTVQNIIFSGLQSALFMMMGFSDDEEAIEDKKIRALNTSLDTILRGGGIAGATVSTLKNMLLKFKSEDEKGWRADHARTLIEAANISPPIGSKLRKLYNSFISYKYNKDEIATLGLHPDNPAILGMANFISATTNIPLDRAVMIANNLRASADSNNATWQRIALMLGWNTWDLGVPRN